jgi:hypothetical protein
MSSKLAVIVAASLLVGACAAAEPIGSRDAGFGEAFKYDTAIQIINPDPVYPPEAAQPGSNGDVGAQAVTRYRTDKVKKVQTMDTTTSSSGSGGSSGR